MSQGKVSIVQDAYVSNHESYQASKDSPTNPIGDALLNLPNLLSGQLTGASLFAGAGGMDVGFNRAGIKTVVASELNEYASNTFLENHPKTRMFKGDVTEKFDEFCSAAKGVDVVFGGPPCQGFSVAGKMDPNDQRSQLVWTFLEAVKRVRPRLFVMENVKALATLQKWSLIRERFVEQAKEIGYECQFVVLKASDFGVPQNRERVFFVGSPTRFSLDDLQMALDVFKCKPPNLRELFRQLPKAGSPQNPLTCTAKITLAVNPVMRRSHYAGMIFNGMGRPLNLDGYSYTLPASMGGNKTPIVDETLIYNHRGLDWVKEYHARLLADTSIATFTEAPSCLRRITALEAAAIQTFPSSYKFMGTKSSIYTQIGNAVPCRLAEAVAKAARLVTIEGLKFEDSAAAFGRLL